MRCELGHDPDVIQMAATLGIDEFGVVGRLHTVWSWLDAHSADGTNVRIVSAFLDRLTACPGFAEAMRTVGWLSGRDGNLTFPNYANHNGEAAKSRASETKRKQKSRKSRDICPVDPGTFVPKNPGPEKRREEKSKDTPLPPEGDGAGKPNRVLPERWQNIPKIDRKNHRVLCNNGTMKRIGAWFGRKPDTLWSLAEGIALHLLNPSPDEIEALESYYTADIPRDDDYRRRDLSTLLNNWSGECDRARIWKAENP